MPTITLSASQDAEIREANPDSNYGDSRSINIQSRQYMNMRGLISFDISQIPKGSAIQTAIMECLANWSSPDRNYHREHLTKRVTDSWIESGVTWNNQPATVDLHSIITQHDYTLATETESYPITAILQDAVNEGATSVSFLIQDNVENAASLIFLTYSSKEGTTAPKLTVTYSEAPIQHTLTVQTTLGGTTNPLPGAYIYNENEEVSVSATPSSGYVFDHWTIGTQTFTENPIELVIIADIVLTAYFTAIPITYAVIVTSSPITGIPVLVDSQSGNTPTSLNLSQGSHTFNIQGEYGTYRFKQWQDELGNIYLSNPLTISISSNKTLTAIYEPIQNYWTLNISSTSGGSTSPSGVQNVPENQSIVVTATPSSGYSLDHWALDGTNIGANASITIGAQIVGTSHTLVAVFSQIPPTQFTLTVATTAGGTTSPTPGAYNYNQGTVANVTAMPNSGYAFDFWSLDGLSRPENPIAITMNQNHSLIAYFTPLPPPEYTLLVQTTSGGNTDPPPGTYVSIENGQIKVTANPSSGYQFDHWILDGITRTENPITVLMNQNHTLTAYFVALPPTYQVLAISALTGGTTNPAPGIYQQEKNTTATVTAIPSSGYSFNHWDLDGVTYQSNPISVLMNTDHSLLAYFSETPPPPPTSYNLTISSTLEGTTDPAPGIHAETSGSTVRITAIPQSGYYFNHWELDATTRTENPIDILMDKDHTLLAVFTEIPPSPIIEKMWILIPVGIIGGSVLAYFLLKKKK